MAMDGGIMDFVQRFQQLQLHRDSGNALIQDLLVYSERIETSLRQENAHLQSQLNDATLDLADATKSRRDLQQQLHQTEILNNSLTQDNQHLKSHNPYVIVLIDGDGLFFKESFVRQGVEGGKKAAYALRAAILQECGDYASEVEVVAKVYLNLSGLGKAMRRDLSLDNEGDLKDFSLGFTQAKASFDFIDVGHGKERADNKIKEITKWNLRNYNCKQIILGISHDAGYAPFLDEMFQDEATRRRVTILEGFPVVRELVATGVNILNLTDTLFRNDKLVDKPAQIKPASPASPALASIASSVASVASVASVTSVTTASSVASVTVVASAGSASASATPSTSTRSTPAPAPAPMPAPAAPPSYARAIGNASPPPQITLPLQPRPVNATPRQQPKPQPTPWSPGPRGLDPPIPVSQSALESIKKRKDTSKLCNNHFLRGPCVKGDACCFEHKYRPTKDEVNAIAFLTRLNPCVNGQDCDVEDCIYGHHCPSVREGVCTHPFCKFGPQEHPPGTKLRTRISEY